MMNRDPSRIGLDDFYTNSGVISLAVSKTVSIIPPRGQFFFDFSAGDGRWGQAMIDAYYLLSGQVDISPQSKSVTKGDFFETSVPDPKPEIIGFNPPFGKQGTLVLKVLLENL